MQVHTLTRIYKKIASLSVATRVNKIKKTTILKHKKQKNQILVKLCYSRANKCGEFFFEGGIKFSVGLKRRRHNQDCGEVSIPHFFSTRFSKTLENK